MHPPHMTTALFILAAWLPIALAVAWLFGEFVSQRRTSEEDARERDDQFDDLAMQAIKGRRRARRKVC